MAKTSDKTKRRIIETARTLFSVHGHKNTTIEDIITATGISKGAFFYHFKSKDNLCEVILEQLKVDYQTLIESVPQELEPFERLSEFLGKLTQLNSSGKWVNCRLFLRLITESDEEQPQLQQKISELWQWYVEFYEDLFKQCIAAGQITAEISVNEHVQTLLSIMSGAIVLGKMGASVTPVSDMVEHHLKTIRL